MQKFWFHLQEFVHFNDIARLTNVRELNKPIGAEILSM